ncbi:MAG TPA: hypothetical protein VGZ22_06085, partial [Isosphaeraceae bacterium]|nr:hypothetical protein [Isosphaeraceae bacterium]
LSDDLLVRKRDQRELEEFLQAARAKLPDRVPPACAQALDDWSLLAQHIKTPLEGQSEDLLAACDRRGIASPTTLLKKLFHLQVVASKGKPLSDEHLHAALKCVRGFYPQDEPALASWLEMVNQVADPQLVDRYQAAFLQGADPRESWRALAQKFHGKGLSAEVEKQMLRLGAGSPRPAGALAARTTAAAVLPPWIKIAAIAGAAVVLVALMIPLLLWQRAEAEKRLITAERNQAQAEVLGITDSVRQSERALEAEKLERKDAEGAFAKSEQALKDDLKRLGDAKEKRDALFAQVQTERNQLRQDTSDAVEQARRALYDYHIALAERELMTDNPDKAKAALVNLQVKQRELAQKRGQPAEAANDPDPPMDWEWQVLMRVCDGSSPREYIPRSINSMAFVDVEGKPAIAWSNVDKVAVWVPSTKEEFEFRRRRELKEVHQLAAYGKGQFLALRQNRLVFLGAIKARDRDGKLDLDGKLINMPELDILKLALSPDCKRLATAYKARQTPGLGTFVRIYADTLKQESERAVVSGEVTALCFSPDAQRVAIGIANGSVEFWEATPSRPPLGTLLSQRPLPKDSVNDLAFSPSGGLLAVAKKAGVIELWDLASGAKEPPVVLVHSASTKPVRSVAFSPDGNWIASGSADRTIKIWDAKTSKERLTLWHNQGVTMVAFSPDGNSLASVGETVPGADAILKVWDLSPAPAAPDKQPTPAPPVRAETGDHR